MNDFFLVTIIALLASFLTYLGAPAAERLQVPPMVVNAALQFAAGIIIALVAFSLMPPAVANGPYGWVILAFFCGGVLFVLLEYLSARIMANTGGAMGLYITVLADLLIDGIVIGIGSTLTLTTGLMLALGLAISTAPLTFVTTATAIKQGMSRERRRLLGLLCFFAVFGGALLGYLILRNISMEIRLILIGLASGFLVTAVIQGMIPEALKDGEGKYAGVLFIGGLSSYALITFSLS